MKNNFKNSLEDRKGNLLQLQNKLKINFEHEGCEQEPEKLEEKN